MRKEMFFAGEALDLAIKKMSRGSVLDVGCGNCGHAKEFLSEGNTVYGSDIKQPPEEMSNWGQFNFYGGNFNTYEFKGQEFDCVWASHVLEHQLNINEFLRKCFRLTKNEGIFAVTVPPAKPNIVGGHVSVWNAGLLLYNMILAGFDCSEAHVKKYGYNISVVVEKRERPPVMLKFDRGDIDILAPYFPKGLNVKENFNGDIQEHNWG